MSLMGSISTESGLSGHVRFTPVSDRTADIAGGPFRANCGHRVPFARARKQCSLTIAGNLLDHGQEIYPGETPCRSRDAMFLERVRLPPRRR
jgi:hypothetical protein